MDLGIAGKVAIVTGGTFGIGRAAAERLAAEGAKVAIAARTQSDLDRVAAEISDATGGEVVGVAADVSDEASVRAMVDAVADRWNRIDMLVNNAGTSSAAPFTDMSNERVMEDFTLKVMGAIYCTRHALPYLKRNGGAICKHDHARREGAERRQPANRPVPRGGYFPDQGVVERVRRRRRPRQHGVRRRTQEPAALPPMGSQPEAWLHAGGSLRERRWPRAAGSRRRGVRSRRRDSLPLLRTRELRDRCRGQTSTGAPHRSF